MAKPRITTYHRTHQPLGNKGMASMRSNNPRGKAQIVQMRMNDGSVEYVPYLLLFPEFDYVVRRCMATFIEPEKSD